MPQIPIYQGDVIPAGVNPGELFEAFHAPSPPKAFGPEARHNFVYQYQLMLRSQLGKRAGDHPVLLRAGLPPVKPSRRSWEEAIRSALTTDLEGRGLQRLLNFYGTGNGDFSRQVYAFESEKIDEVELVQPEFFTYLDGLSADESQGSNRVSRDYAASGPVGRQALRDRQRALVSAGPVAPIVPGLVPASVGAHAAPRPPVARPGTSASGRAASRASRRPRIGRKPLNYASVLSPAVTPEMHGQELARAILLNRTLPRGMLLDVLTQDIVDDVRMRNAAAEREEIRSRSALSYLDVSTELQTPLCGSSLAIPGHLKVPLRNTDLPDIYNKAFNGWYRYAGNTALSRTSGKSVRTILSSQAAALWRHTLDLELLPPHLLKGMAAVYARICREKNMQEQKTGEDPSSGPPAKPSADGTLEAQGRGSNPQNAHPHSSDRKTPRARRWRALGHFEIPPPTSRDPSGLMTACIPLLGPEERKNVIDHRVRILDVSMHLIDWNIDLSRLRALEAL